MRNVSKQTLAHLALLGANIFYGAGFSVAKTVMPALIAPFAFIFLRVGITCLLFWIIFAFGKIENATIEKKDWLLLLACAMFGIAINQLMFFKGLSLTSPIHASLIMLSTPILVTIIAAFASNEKLTNSKIIGLLVGVSGAVLLVSMGKKSTLSTNPMLGDLFVLINALSYAIYLVIVKPLMRKYSPLLVIRWVFTFGFLMVFPFSFHSLLQIQWQILSPNNYIAIAFIVVCVTFCTYLWNTYSLKILSASTAGSYIFLQPLFAAIIAILFFAEEITLVKIIAALLIFVGVFLVSRKSKTIGEIDN